MTIEIVMMDLDKILVYKNNSKKHPQAQIDKLARSILEFGFNVPVIVDKNNMLIAGHGRLLAAKQAGLIQLPTIKKDGLTEAQIKAYRIADNKTAESSWDYNLLKDEMKDLQALDFDMDLTGFSESEIVTIEENKLNDLGTQNVDKIGSLELKCPHCGKKFKKGDKK